MKKTDLEYAIELEYLELIVKATNYLRRLVKHFGAEPLNDLMGLCTQIDNILAFVPKLQKSVDEARDILDQWTYGQETDEWLEKNPPNEMQTWLAANPKKE